MSNLHDYYTNNNIDLTKEYDITKKFLNSVDPYVGGIPVCFITAPKLNLEANLGLSEFLSELKRSMPTIFSGLDKTYSSFFVPIVTNYFKGLNGKDLAARTIDVGETMYGWKQTLPGPQVDSVVGDTVSLKFYETKYLPIIKLHKVWMDYIENVSSGYFAPNLTCLSNNEIDYMCSIYYFVLDTDLETILYYCKYTGAAPVSNPYGELVSSIGDTRDVKEVEIEYVYNLKEDLNPAILSDFNKCGGTIPYTNNNESKDDPKDQANKNVGSFNLYIPPYDDSGFNKLEDNIKLEVFSNYLNNPKKQPVIVRTSESSVNGITPRVKYKLVFKESGENR